jgi:hypothetical protein
MRIFFYCVFCGSLLAAQDASRISALPDAFQFAGTWACEGAFGNGKAHKAVFTGTTILDGKWLELTEKDVEPVTGYVAKYLIGYDSEHKQLVEFDANNFGASVYTSADGWKNNVLTMTSSVAQDPKAPYAMNRFLYSITATDKFTVDWQISRTAAPVWVASDHLNCKRQ